MTKTPEEESEHLPPDDEDTEGDDELEEESVPEPAPAVPPEPPKA